MPPASSSPSAAFVKHLTVWNASARRHSKLLTIARMWKMFADAGCHPGLDNPLAIECSPMAAMTDRRLTPFQRLLYKPPTDDDPTAFLAVRTTGTEDGLAVFDLPPRLMASTEGHRLDGIALVEETELRRLYPADRLVTWV